ncbi:hypothetical protein GCM10025787_30660 [Saccharopolyspora rosea]
MVALSEPEHLVQRGHARARDRLLRARERVVSGVGRAAGAAVERADLGEREVVDRLADVRVGPVAGERRSGVPAQQGCHHGFVGDQDLAVPGDRGVHLQRADTDAQRLVERREGVLRPQPAGAPVTLGVEGGRVRWSGRGGADRRRTDQRGGDRRHGDRGPQRAFRAGPPGVACGHGEFPFVLRCFGAWRRERMMAGADDRRGNPA